MSAARRASQPPPPRSREEEYEDVEPASPQPIRVKPPSEVMRMLRQERVAHLGALSEVKFFETTASTGVLSQNTWNSYDQLSNLATGTGQNQRIGRMIRIKRLRVTINCSQAAHDTVVGHILLMRVDPTVASSDLWASNGSARVALSLPNPLCHKQVFGHSVKTAMQYAGAAAGTTPSYSSFVHVIDHDFGKGHRVVYDAAGAVMGPTPVPYCIVDETSLTFDVGYQLWFTDE